MMLLCFFIAFSILSIVMTARYSFLTYPRITGRGLTGIVRLFVEGGGQDINISSPENKTYNFSIGSIYLLDLNVSANFATDSWWYTLIDLKHNVTIDEDIPFDPNTTFSAVRWSNKLLVYANDSSGAVANANVTFSIYIPNSAPIIEDLPPEIFVCENEQTSSYFNVTDADEDDNGDIEPDITPVDPFFIFPLTYSFSSGENKTQFQIISTALSKSQATGSGEGWIVYERNVSVKDNYNGTCCADSDVTNITAIEINNAPYISSMENQTVWTIGTNTTFYHQTSVADTEDGNQDSGNFSFNVTILNSTGSNVNLFNISEYGVMNYTSNESDIGVYNVTIYVIDREINNPHENITDFCGQTGENITSSADFSLTITDINRAPIIVNYYPTDLILNVGGTDSLYFNITKYDADGTIPDAYWYVDNIFQEFDNGTSGSSVDEFTPSSFGCGVSGVHTISINVTDGLATSSIQWNISVNLVACPPSVEGVVTGGGGGEGIKRCPEKWVCYDWGTCQNVEESLEAGILSREDYRDIKGNCSQNRRYGEFCGFQLRNCFEVNNCNTTRDEPEDMQDCYYTEKPDCEDGIKNCHDGECEFLIDCGGPCPTCPTCSDKTKNQGEEEIDCGGPCPWTCPDEKPFIRESHIRYALIILIVLLLGIIIIKVIKITKSGKRVEKKKKLKYHKK